MKKNRQHAQSVLGLTLSDGQLRAFHVARTRGGLEVVKAASATLSLDLLHPEAELVGREIKNHLDEAGIRERHCVVGLPARWVMSLHTKVPEMSPEDTESFLQLEAEKGFPVDPAQLRIAHSTQRSAAGVVVTQLAVRREQIDQLGLVLKAAGLKPVSFSLGLAVLPEANSTAGHGRMIVAVEPAGVSLLVAADGGIAAFRTGEASIESEAGERLVNGAAVARDLRITLEQLPPETRAEVRELFLTGEATMVRQLAENLRDWAAAAGLAIARGDLPEKNLAGVMAERLATQWLEAGALPLEFLPPRPSRWTLLLARYNSKRLAATGFGVAGLAVLALLAFGIHEVRLWLLRSEWSGMQTQVAALDAVDGRRREFRPFYDTSFRTLTIMKRITECFPDNGSVTAKSFEIRGSSVVTINGTARDNASLLRVQDALHKAKEVQGLKVEQIRGSASKSPMQFTLTFRWNSGSGT
ncbi:MAG TPA: hypothetical protein VHD62_01520 [Opitutaceae bacterium]|nr:hypothetical protein [Opitutaceae bacterium]